MQQTQGREQLLWFDVERDLEDAARIRRELASGQVDDADRMRSTKAKHALLVQAELVTARLRDVANGIIAAGLLEGGKPGKKLDDRYDDLADVLRAAYPTDITVELSRNGLDSLIDEGLTPTVETGEAIWKPLHWILEVPDIIRGRGGFDAIIGNPPFLGGKKVSKAIGANVRQWLTDAIAFYKRGNADLVSYFLLRAHGLLARSGVLGIIATNTLAQGDTREVGLDQLAERGMIIFRAIQSKPWPSSSANLEYAAVWASAHQRRPHVPRISTLLEQEGKVEGLPRRLAGSKGVAFKGVNINGLGFLLTPSQARDMIVCNPRNVEVVKPYYVGADLNATPGPVAPRWIVDFGNRTEQQALTYSGPAQWVEPRVRANRAHLDNKPKLREEWWRFEASAKELRSVIAGSSQMSG